MAERPYMAIMRRNFFGILGINSRLQQDGIPTAGSESIDGGMSKTARGCGWIAMLLDKFRVARLLQRPRLRGNFCITPMSI